MIQQLLSAHVTIALLTANIAISIAAFNNPRLIDQTLFHVGAMRRRGEWHRMVTSGFVHANPAHLFMNMITLFFFGPALEVGLGPVNFAMIYFMALIGGSAWALMENFNDLEYRALGASRGSDPPAPHPDAVRVPATAVLFAFIDAGSSPHSANLGRRGQNLQSIRPAAG